MLRTLDIPKYFETGSLGHSDLGVKQKEDGKMSRSSDQPCKEGVTSSTELYSLTTANCDNGSSSFLNVQGEIPMKTTNLKSLALYELANYSASSETKADTDSAMPEPVGAIEYLATPAHVNRLFPFLHPVLFKLEGVPATANVISCFGEFGDFKVDGNSRMLRLEGLNYAIITFRPANFVHGSNNVRPLGQDLSALPNNISVKVKERVINKTSPRRIIADVFLNINSQYNISGTKLLAYPVVLQTAENSPAGLAEMDTNLDCVFAFTKIASPDLLVLNPLIAVMKGKRKRKIGNIYHGHVVLRSSSATIKTPPDMFLGTVEQVSQDGGLLLKESLQQEQYLCKYLVSGLQVFYLKTLRFLLNQNVYTSSD